MICAQEDFEDGLNLLIKFKADTNLNFSGGYHRDSANKENNSALLLAAKPKHEECVKILIDHAADISYKNNKGQNLLMVACEQGLLETVKYCLSHGGFFSDY